MFYSIGPSTEMHFGHHNRGKQVIGNTKRDIVLLFANILQKSWFKIKKKKILNGISAYFNPSELIAILGPSGM